MQASARWGTRGRVAWALLAAVALALTAVLAVLGAGAAVTGGASPTAARVIGAVRGADSSTGLLPRSTRSVRTGPGQPTTVAGAPSGNAAAAGSGHSLPHVVLPALPLLAALHLLGVRRASAPRRAGAPRAGVRRQRAPPARACLLAPSGA